MTTFVTSATSVAVAMLTVVITALLLGLARRSAASASAAAAAAPPQRAKCLEAVGDEDGEQSPKGPRFARFSRTAARIGGEARAKLKRLRGEPRSASTPPERPSRRHQAMRALSPHVRLKQVDVRLKQRFGQNVANALGEGGAGHIPQSYSSDGLRLTRDVARQRLRDARPTLPRGNTAPDATGVPEELLPSDAAPWDRLHVWLVAGDALPARPRLWPFEPHIVVSALGDAPLPTDTFAFQSTPEFSSSTRPVWDEQGLICYRRAGGATKFRVVVMASSRVWSGLYHPRCLKPTAFFAQVRTSLVTTPWARVLTTPCHHPVACLLTIPCHHPVGLPSH